MSVSPVLELQARTTVLSFITTDEQNRKNNGNRNTASEHSVQCLFWLSCVAGAFPTWVPPQPVACSSVSSWTPFQISLGQRTMLKPQWPPCPLYLRSSLSFPLPYSSLPMASIQSPSQHSVSTPAPTHMGQHVLNSWPWCTADFSQAARLDPSEPQSVTVSVLKCPSQAQVLNSPFQ